MLRNSLGSAFAALLLTAPVDAFIKLPLGARQLPANATDVKTITTPTGVTIRYKEPGQAGVCETTAGVNSYSGYIDIAPDVHTFFWFFESRSNPSTDQITLWLNGGPGSDSLIGLFQELGPCNITSSIDSALNPYSWNAFSNLLFLSQPLGTGFSYAQTGEGSLNGFTGDFQNASVAPVTGRWPVIDAEKLDTSDLAAVAAYHVLQGFYSALPQLASEVGSKAFNLWTESYGGHYGPAFYNYFYEQNALIANGTNLGVELSMNSLGIGNGIIDEATQVPHYAEFAVNNTYGIKAINDTAYNYMQMATYMPNGCLDQVRYCRATNRTSPSEQAICAEAGAMCRDNVEGLYYSFGDRGTYDIRINSSFTDPPDYFVEYLNDPEVQNAIGVNLNYTSANTQVYYAFQQTGDFVYPNFIEDIEMLLDAGVRVALYYGDADYICNWFGGEAVSLAVNYTDAAHFRAAGYAPFVVDGTEYGAVRQFGNFSFLRIYEAGHLVPYYQPKASLEMYNRTIHGWDIADGTERVTINTDTEGPANSTFREQFVQLPEETGTGMSRAEIKDPFAAKIRYRPSF